MPSVEKFKRAFQKHFKSDAQNVAIRDGKVQAALDQADRYIAHLESSGDAKAPGFRARYITLTVAADAAFEKSKTEPKIAFSELETVKKDALSFCTEVAKAGKKVPLQLPLGSRDVAIYPTDIPGFEEIPPAKREERVGEIAAKVASGAALFAEIESGREVNIRPEERHKKVADLMWFLKGRAQQTAGEAYERGALTIPDPGGKIKQFLHDSGQAYIRGSSHMSDQQKKAGGQAHGIDFVQGVGENGQIDNVDLLLPCGMSTLLYQQVKTGNWNENERLYCKMETEPSPWNPLGMIVKSRPDEGNPNSRPHQEGDRTKTVKHGVNLVKAKVGDPLAKMLPILKGIVTQPEDEDLKNFREGIHKAIEKSYDKALASAKAHNKVAYEILGKGKLSVHQLFHNVEELVNHDNVDPILDVQTARHLMTCIDTVKDAYGGLDDVRQRVGGEVVIDPSAQNAARTAILLLSMQLAAIKACDPKSYGPQKREELTKVLQDSAPIQKTIEAKSVLMAIPAVQMKIEELKTARAWLQEVLDSKPLTEKVIN